MAVLSQHVASAVSRFSLSRFIRIGLSEDWRPRVCLPAPPQLAHSRCAMVLPTDLVNELQGPPERPDLLPAPQPQDAGWAPSGRQPSSGLSGSRRICQQVWKVKRQSIDLPRKVQFVVRERTFLAISTDGPLHPLREKGGYLWVTSSVAATEASLVP